LRLRSVDLSGISRSPVRAFRGRCGDPLCDRTSSLGGAGGNRASVRRYRIESASREDENSVLQGQSAAPGSPGDVVYVLRLCVSSPEGLQQGRGKGIHEVSTCGRSWQVDGYEPKGGLVEDTSAHHSNPLRPRAWREPGSPGLAQLLHGVLSKHGDSVVLAC